MSYTPSMFPKNVSCRFAHSALLVLLAFIPLSITAKEAQTEVVYIDVRTWAEQQIDAIEGDVRIHVSEIVEGVSEQFPDKTTPIRLYCARGGRAQSALEKLMSAGYQDVQNLGGIDDARVLRSIEK